MNQGLPSRKWPLLYTFEYYVSEKEKNSAKHNILCSAEVKLLCEFGTQWDCGLICGMKHWIKY